MNGEEYHPDKAIPQNIGTTNGGPHTRNNPQNRAVSTTAAAADAQTTQKPHRTDRKTPRYRQRPFLALRQPPFLG